MPEEMETPTETTETEVVETEAPEVEAEPTEETPWYVEAGFEDAESALKKVKNLKAWEADVTRRAMEAKKAPIPEPSVQSDDPWSRIETVDDLKAAVAAEAERIAAAKYADLAPMAESAFNATLQSTYDSFIKERGVDDEQLRTVMNGYDLWPNSYNPADLVQRLDLAAAYLERQNAPKVRAEIEEKVAAEAAERAAKGEKVIAVKPGKQSVAEPEADLDDNQSIWNKLLGG